MGAVPFAGGLVSAHGGVGFADPEDVILQSASRAGTTVAVAAATTTTSFFTYGDPAVAAQGGFVALVGPNDYVWVDQLIALINAADSSAALIVNAIDMLLADQTITVGGLLQNVIHGQLLTFPNQPALPANSAAQLNWLWNTTPIQGKALNPGKSSAFQIAVQFAVTVTNTDAANPHSYTIRNLGKLRIARGYSQ
jgi:hypothetical protein